VEKPEASVIHSSSPREQTNVLLQAAVSPVTSEIGIKSAGYKTWRRSVDFRRKKSKNEAETAGVIEEITKGRGNPAGSAKLQTTKWNNDKTNHHARPFPLEINERDGAN
jgi:hypothetical protein